MWIGEVNYPKSNREAGTRTYFVLDGSWDPFYAQLHSHLSRFDDGFGYVHLSILLLSI